MNLKLVFISCIMTVFSSHLFSHKNKFEPSQKIVFPSPTMEEMGITECSFYPEAKVLILDKCGSVSFPKVLKGHYYHHGIRLMILDESAKDAANLTFNYYSPKGTLRYKEIIMDLRAVSYNVVDGYVQMNILEDENIHYNRLSDELMEINLIFPDVKKGTVVECTFTKRSDFLYNIEGWNFQLEYPVLNSEFVVNNHKKIKYQERFIGKKYNLEVKKQEDKSIFKMSNIPPIEPEPFISNFCDLAAQVDVKFVSADFKENVLSLTSGYEGIYKSLIGNRYFWKAATKGVFPDELMAKAATFNGVEKAEFLYNWIQENIVWNHRITYQRYPSLKSLLKEKYGNVADINLTLNALFRENNLTAYPVVLSTRGNGLLHKEFPQISDFDYVISVVYIEDVAYFCDATTNNFFGLLPPRCLNYSGFMVRDEGGMLIDLMSKGKYKSNIITDIYFENNNLIADLKINEREYAALSTIDDIEIGEEDYIEFMKSIFSDWNMTEHEIKIGKNVVSENYKLEKEQDIDNIIYIEPFIYGLTKQNLLKRDVRLSDVELIYGNATDIEVNINIPDGYELKELPERREYVMKDEAGSIAFQSFVSERKVTLRVDIKIDKIRYSPEEYHDLKAFYDFIAETANMQLVLNKINIEN